MSKDLGTPNWSERIVDLSELKPYERNPRKISDSQLAILKDSLLRLGQFAPIQVTQDLRIMGGHQRLKAFRELGWDKIRVTVPDREIPHEMFKEIVIRSNVENGAWIDDILQEDYTREELEGMGVEDFDWKVDEPDGDDEPDEKPQNTIIQYNIIFDDEAQQQVWFDFVRYLKDRYQGGSLTVAERLVAFIRETADVEDGGNG